MGHNRPRNRQTRGKKAKHPSLLKRINRNAATFTELLERVGLSRFSR